MIARRSLIAAAGAVFGLAFGVHGTLAAPQFGTIPRATLRYRDQPLGEKSCVTCGHFISAERADGAPHCSVVAGVVSPHGYCVAWQDRNPSNSCWDLAPPVIT